MSARELRPKPLDQSTFAPFGEVVSLDRAEQIPINDGLTTRFNDLAHIDVATGGGRVAVNLFRSSPIPLPHRVQRLERHPLGSQLFYPLGAVRFLVLVAPASARVQADDLQLFVSNGSQGVNFHRNTWHHYQMVLGHPADFIVVDRLGPGNNLEEQAVDGAAVVLSH